MAETQQKDVTKKNYTLRLDPELVRKFDQAAKSENRSRTNAVETLMMQYIQEKTAKA